MPRINRIITLLLLFGAYSCVKDVSFSGAYDKKVVVNCILHSRARYYEPFPEWVTPAPKTPITVQYEQETDFDIQHLFLSYNCNDAGGNVEKVENATATLYDNNTNEQLGTFVRVSDYEWQLHYHIPYETVDETHKHYNVNYRLEITGIPGHKSITAYSSLNRTIGTEAIRIDTNEDALWYNMTEGIDGPTWITSFAFDREKLKSFPREDPQYFDLCRTYENKLLSNGRGSLLEPCPYADNFNYDEPTSYYSYAIKLRPFTSPFSDNNSFGIRGKTLTLVYELLINYVSEEYDHFLKESIIFNMRHGDNSDPTQHLFEDQVYTNISDGTGIFGIEAAYMFSQKDYSYYSHLFSDK